MHLNTDAYQNNFSGSYLLWLFISPRYYITYVLFISDLFLTIVVVVSFPSYSIMITSKTLESVVCFCRCNAPRCFFLSVGGRFLTELHWNDYWPVLLVVVFFCCPAIFSPCSEKKNCSTFWYIISFISILIYNTHPEVV